MIFKTQKYRAIFNRYKNDIYGYALFMMRNKMDAEDVSQEVLIKLWNNMENFDINKTKSWLMRTTHNLCIDYLRKRHSSRNGNYSIDERAHENIAASAKESDPSYLTDVSFMNEKVKIAVSKMPDKLKSVFVLYQISGMKYQEISDALEIPLNSVKVYLMRARRKLQEELKDYEPSRI